VAEMTPNIFSLLVMGLATPALILVLTLLGSAFRRLHARLDAWHGNEDAYASRGPLRAPRAAAMLHMLARLVRIIITLALLHGYGALTLRMVPWGRPYATGLEQALFAVLHGMTRAIALHAPDALFLTVVLVAAYVIVKSARFVFSALAKGTIRLPGFYADWAE